jgi:hypothetical protein
MLEALAPFSRPRSTLHFTRDVIALRRRRPALRSGGYVELPTPAGGWAGRRGDASVVALNLGADLVEIGGVAGTVAISTNRARDGEEVAGRVALAPSEGVVVAR